jgi:hypothetical protein
VPAGKSGKKKTTFSSGQTPVLEKFVKWRSQFSPATQSVDTQLKFVARLGVDPQKLISTFAHCVIVKASHHIGVAAFGCLQSSGAVAVALLPKIEITPGTESKWGVASVQLSLPVPEVEPVVCSCAAKA